MKRLLFRLLLALITIAAVLLVGVYKLIENSLPQLDGSVQASGLQSTAKIVRDAAGIPTITAGNRTDVAFATGFVHGQDRFFQMDLSRRSAAGELSELFGAVALPRDRRHRWHRFRSRSQAVLAQASDFEKGLLAAYAAGVNSGLASLSARPFEYFVIDAKPKPWLPEDSLLVAFAMFMTLNDERAAADVGRGLASNVFPAEVFQWLYPVGTEWDAPVEGEVYPTGPVPDADVFDWSGFSNGSESGEVHSEAPLIGSNNWAVSGSITKSGRAIVANDMHLGINVPNIFYRARFVVTGEQSADVSGLSLPGTPVMVAGSNGHVAWGFTNSHGDWSDAIVLRPGAEVSTYVTPQGPLAYEVVEETIAVKDGDADVLAIRETIWGPVLDDGSYPDNDVAIRWTAHDTSAVNLNFVFLETVQSVDDALAIANTMGGPPQNFVCGDAEGNIGWTIAGKIPLRRAVDTRLPVDWSEQEGWPGWLPATEYPRIVNPESGRIWTANARVVDGDALTKVGDSGYALGARAGQIRDSLFASDSFEPVDMLPIQVDDRALFLERWRDLLLETLSDQVTTGRDDLKTYRRLVEDWTPRASADSVGYRLVREFRSQVRTLVFDMLMIPVRERYGADVRLHIERQFEGPLWALVSERPAHMLSADYADWQQLLLHAADLQIARYSERFGRRLENRSWGERNTAAIRHPLSRALPFLSEWLDMPADELSGDMHMPKAIGPSFGASERFAVAPGDEGRAYLHMPAGQSGHPMSDFYRVGHDDWVQARPTPFLPGEALHELTLVPAD